MEKRIGIMMNGVTGRMGSNQHLTRSILAIRKDGGVPMNDGSVLMPEPLLIGRNEAKLRAMAERLGGLQWSTDLQAALQNKDYPVYFDSGTTVMRERNVLDALAAGKNVYCEKPLAVDTAGAVRLAEAAEGAGILHGVVQDKLFLPGIRKMRRLVESGFFGKILSVRGDFGYWIFEGNWGVNGQRPSWNYRKEDGGGIILDMFAHWRYLLDRTFGSVRSVQCIGATHVPERVDENGKTYICTADDAAYATFELEGGIVAQINSSWTTRVYRDELFVIQVDGTQGSAIAGLTGCRTQHRVNTPRAVWNPDVPNQIDFRADWQEVPDGGHFDNAFRVQWEMYLRALIEGTPFVHDFWDGARGVQLAEIATQSWKERRWLDIPPLRTGAAHGAS
jgi:predicted dehydrogenase